MKIIVSCSLTVLMSRFIKDLQNWNEVLKSGWLVVEMKEKQQICTFRNIFHSKFSRGTSEYSAVTCQDALLSHSLTPVKTPHQS